MSAPASLADFVAANLGKTVGDTPENQGQCVGLIELWLDNLGKPHVWGNAADLLNNADLTAYQVFRNSPTNFPQAGDVVCWDTTWGGGFGHTAVVLAANVNRLAVAEQNNPIASPVVVATHDYSGVAGWIRAR